MTKALVILLGLGGAVICRSPAVAYDPCNSLVGARNTSQDSYNKFAVCWQAAGLPAVPYCGAGHESDAGCQ